MAYLAKITRAGALATTALGEVEIPLSKEHYTRIRVNALPGTNVAHVSLVLANEQRVRVPASLIAEGLIVPNDGTPLEWLIHPMATNSRTATIQFVRATAAAADVELRVLVEEDDGK